MRQPDKQGFAKGHAPLRVLLLLVLATFITNAFYHRQCGGGSIPASGTRLQGNLMNFRRDIATQHDAAAARPGRLLLSEWGDFIEQLAPWDWRWTITFRNSFWDLESPSNSLRPPSKDWSLRALDGFLNELQQEVGSPIIWVIGEDFGRLGRFHAHILVANVVGPSIDEWTAKAFRRFGRNRLDYYEARRGGAHYLAKHALTETGGVHFGGAGLPGERLQNSLPVGRVVVARSANVPSSLYHMTLGRRRQR